MSGQDPELQGDPVEGDVDDGAYFEGGSRRKRGRGLPGCLAVLVALVVIVGGGYLLATKGATYIKDHFQPTPDFSGPGVGRVIFQVKQGDTATDMGRGLKALGVVKSVDAFVSAANGDPQSGSIQVGYYAMRKEMKASDALQLLENKANLLKTVVTIPEGLRVVDIVALLAKKTNIPQAKYDAALKDPAALGLPSYANGKAEGYLFPATYDIPPKSTATSILKMMVTRWQQAATQDGIVAAAARLGKTPGEIMTIASLVQAEGRGSDMPKIARVIYNRLDGPGSKGGTNGLLQIDATVNYALNRTGVVAVTTAETQGTNSPYNTYLHPGLPPGPIEAPGDAAIKAATTPAAGPWYYYITVNLRTGLTKFYADYNGFLQGRQEYAQYCQTSSRC